MVRPHHSSEHYAKRLHRVLHYVDGHLTQRILLPELAAQAAFSPYHFHRIFCQWQGETPQAYIRRRRLERAAALLRYGKDVYVMEIAPQCGFTSVEAFDRAFLQYFGMTPGQWRKGGYLAWQVQSAPQQALAVNLQFEQVKVQRFVSQAVLYQRKLGAYREGEAALWQHIEKTAHQHHLKPQIAFGIGIDDPAVTPEAHCRFDACIALPEQADLPVHLPQKTIAGGMYAVLPYHGKPGQTEGHWLWLLQQWLPNSLYRVGQHPCFERYPAGIPHGDEVRSELCLPVVRKR